MAMNKIQLHGVMQHFSFCFKTRLLLGTQLAVYASAWKDEKDLADIFVFWNGYTYGKVYSVKHIQLTEGLKPLLLIIRLLMNRTCLDVAAILVPRVE